MRGVQLHYPAEVVSLNKDEDETVVGVNLVSNGGNVLSEIACKSIVIASRSMDTSSIPEFVSQINHSDSDFAPGRIQLVN